MDRTIIRETGTSDQVAPRPSGDFDGVTRRDAMEALLGKHVAPRRFSNAGSMHTISGRQMMAQSEHAARVWERLHPGKPAHFEVDCTGVERRLFKHYAPWHLRARFAMRRALRAALPLFGILALAANAHGQTRQEIAADIMRRLDTPANVTMHPPCTDCDGSRIYIMASTPGAASWLTFPPEREHLRLDGTPLSQPPTVYGGVNAYWPIFVPATDHRSGDRRRVQPHVARPQQ